MKYRIISKFAVVGVSFGLGLGLVSQRADACGGFFCSQQQPVNQAAERIIFADNGDGTVTAVIQILYEGPSESFSWLLPISTVPEGDDLQVASDLAFTRLQFATNPLYSLVTQIEGTCRSDAQLGGAVAVTPDRETCDDNPYLAECGAPRGNGVNVEAAGVVGAFEWTVISVAPNASDPAVPALEWLLANGYDATPQSAGLIGPYLADGMYLLALRLTKGADTGSIRPIRLTYQADAPMIPIKLTAVAANSDMGVMTWALSSARAVPFNYNALELNEARLNWFNPASNYNQLVIEAADAAGGQGFVTEFAGRTSSLAGVVWTEFDEVSWQSLRSAVYTDFTDIFSAAYDQYQEWNGFWDAVRRVVTLPPEVAFDDFRLCPGCYSDEIQFSPSAFMNALESDVIEPLRGVQTLIDSNAYATRLYTTLSAAEMLVDPVFRFNPDLPEVSNVHQATRFIECSEDVITADAPWRIELPQGSVIRGTAQSFGEWPDAVAAQPANFRVLTLSTSGEGVVVDDNATEIDGLLAEYNASLPPPSRASSSGGFCAVAPGTDAGPRAPFTLALWGLVGLAGLRRRLSSARAR